MATIELYRALSSKITSVLGCSSSMDIPMFKGKDEYWKSAEENPVHVNGLVLFGWKTLMTISHVFCCKITPSKRVSSALIEESKWVRDDMRAMLRITELPIIPSTPNHSHPDAAAERTAASMRIVETVRAAGLEPYMVSMAPMDQRSGLEGSRLSYWAKDVKASTKDDYVKPNSAIVMIDVDYYLDINKYLGYGVPVIIYTLSPDVTGRTTTDTAMTIEDNKVRFRVSGGAHYEHEVWDYDREIVVARDSRHFFRHWIYDVEVRTIIGEFGLSRKIVIFTPVANLRTMYLHTVEGTDRITRKRYENGGVNLIYDPIGKRVAVGMPGSFVTVEMCDKDFRAMMHRCKTKALHGDKVQLYDVETFLYNDGAVTKDIKVQASLLHEIMAKNLGIELAPNYSSTSAINTKYSLIKTGVQPNMVKDVCHVFTPPIVAHPAIFPVEGLNNDIAAIEGRVLQPTNTAIPSLQYQKLAEEFVERLTRDAVGVGSPWSVDQVIEQQTKTQQRARIARTKYAIGVGAENTLTTFKKGEAYNVANDPRVITQCDPIYTVEFSRFTYAFKTSVLKRFKFWGPCKTPLESARRVNEIAKRGAIETDYSRFDGTVSEWLQKNVVMRAYMKWIHPDHAKMLKHYLDQCFKMKARSRNGVKYNPGWGTRSGSPITTDSNTMVNSCIHYVALRTIGMTHEEAWENMGIYAGDDGLTSNIPNLSNAIAAVSLDFGLQVKMITRELNEPLGYLGRRFPLPASSVDSIQDLARTLPKIHMSANVGVELQQAAYNKCIGYLTTDAKTPILSDYCRRVIRDANVTEVRGLLGEESYKIDCGAWPQEDGELLLQFAQSELNMTAQEMSTAIAAIRDCDDISKMPVVWNNPEYEHKRVAIVGDTLHNPRIVSNGSVEVNTVYTAKSFSAHSNRVLREKQRSERKSMQDDGTHIRNGVNKQHSGDKRTTTGDVGNGPDNEQQRQGTSRPGTHNRVTRNQGTLQTNRNAVHQTTRNPEGPVNTGAKPRNGNSQSGERNKSNRMPRAGRGDVQRTNGGISHNKTTRHSRARPSRSDRPPTRANGDSSGVYSGGSSTSVSTTSQSSGTPGAVRLTTDDLQIHSEPSTNDLAASNTTPRV